MLKKDDTILSILHLLEDKESYVRRVADMMRDCNKNYPNPTVKIGVSKHSKGKRPYYWIEYPIGNSMKTFGTFQYSSKFENKLDSREWSDKPMMLQEVENLLAEIEAGKA